MEGILPPNVHVSSHPCLQAKLSQLRSASLSAKGTKTTLQKGHGFAWHWGPRRPDVTTETK
ncbi:hypothetical protein B0T24DRAFT_642239 [Lasiosphaeria ovina]|uniref:Uncharacterized protein n=1 Tax=Lasiosphaeria ovina TaxID=92902 RepID=A0AAE0MYK4_9PEZI|nr:hypothetical protein B0T24DRAFT_642239 [Lasiosphaeria ovina]